MLRLLAVCFTVTFAGTALSEYYYPKVREDSQGLMDEFVVEFDHKLHPDDAQSIIKSSDFKVERNHRQLGNVFKLSYKDNKIGNLNHLQKRVMTEKSLKFLHAHPRVAHASQLEVLVRVKRGMKSDKDAAIEYSRHRPYPKTHHQLQDHTKKPQAKTCEQAVFTDPLFADQWQICNSGQKGGNSDFDMNVMPVWTKRNITGRGVKVCILDDGVDFRHPDLLENFDPRASQDMNNPNKKNDPTPRGDEYNSHGTQCAGVVAAVANNSICGVGIAYGAKVGGIRMLDGKVSDFLESEAVSFNIDYIDIFSASWGPTDNGATLAGPGILTDRALQMAVEKGRGGLGTVFIWASGNGGMEGDDCGADGYASNVNVVSIGSVDTMGNAPVYMEECSSTLAVVFVGSPKFWYSTGPSTSMVSTTIDDQCTEEFSGTSAAAPAGAGIAALMLEANPKMTYRDVMHIIVNTGVNRGLNADWFTNAANHTFSRRFGFGRLDADKLVGLALKWKRVPELHICEPAIQDLKGAGVEFEANGVKEIELDTDACASDPKKRINYAEHVQLYIDLEHPRRGDVNLTLVSPSGTRSLLLANRPNDNKEIGIGFPFTTIHFWGEPLRGTWKVFIGDRPQGEPISGLRRVNRIGLLMRGTDAPVEFPADKDKPL